MTDPATMFDRLDPDELDVDIGADENEQQKIPIVPVPHDAPPMQFRHPIHGIREVSALGMFSDKFAEHGPGLVIFFVVFECYTQIQTGRFCFFVPGIGLKKLAKGLRSQVPAILLVVADAKFVVLGSRWGCLYSRTAYRAEDQTPH